MISDATWDVFTGSAPYLEVVKRMLTPRVLFQLVRALWTRGAEEILKATTASVNNQAHCDGGGPGRHYEDGDVIVREGDIGDHMYVVQQGRVEVYRERGGRETQLALLGEGAIFGEMALCDHDVRSASVRASGRVRVLTVDRKTFLRGVHEDPSLSLRIVQQLSRRIRLMDDELIRLKAQRSVPTEAAGLSRMESRSR